MSSNHGEEPEDKFRKKLAQWLGITFDEIEEYGEDVLANDGAPGKDKYGYFIQFSDAASLELLRRIKRIDRNRNVFFNLEELES